MVYMCIAVAAVPWYNICVVLQIDKCRYFIIVFQQNSYAIREMPYIWHIVDVVYMHMHVAALPRPAAMIVDAIYTCTFSSLIIDRIFINSMDI